jgi:hypothetical protein
VQVDEAETGFVVVLLLATQSPQVPDADVVAWTGFVLLELQSFHPSVVEALTGLVVVAVADQFSQPPLLYGQLVTVGSQLVIVTSTVSVIVVVPALAMAARPDAMMTEERILVLEIVLNYRKAKKKIERRRRGCWKRMC